MWSLCSRTRDITCSSSLSQVSSWSSSLLSYSTGWQQVLKSYSMFIYIFCFYQLMSAPVSPEDQGRVQKSFDEEAGTVGIIALIRFMQKVNKVFFNYCSKCFLMSACRMTGWMSKRSWSCSTQVRPCTLSIEASVCTCLQCLKWPPDGSKVAPS